MCFGAQKLCFSPFGTFFDGLPKQNLINVHQMIKFWKSKGLSQFDTIRQVEFEMRKDLG